MNAPKRSTRSHLALGAFMAAMLVPVPKLSAQGVRRPMPEAAYQRLDSLEQVALSAPSFAARLHAVSTITSIASGEGTCARGPVPTVIKYPGLVDRLASIYQRSSDDALRHTILDRMLWQVECDKAAEFLAQVAGEEPAPSRGASGGIHDAMHSTRQSHAIDVLATLGPRGETVLRQLHGQSSVRDSTARAALDRLARRNFRRPR